MQFQTVTAEEVVENVRLLIRRSILENQRKAPQRRPRKPQTNGGLPLYETQIVSEDRLLSYLNEGWDIIMELADGRIILRRPNGLDE